MKYRVTGKVICYVTVEIESESSDKQEIFTEAGYQFGGISEFVGNGGTDKLIGVYRSYESIRCDDEEVEWEDFEVIEG